jgi:hypothetical protein
MVSSNNTFDVFVAYDLRDRVTATQVAELLRARGLAVFHDVQQVPTGTNVEDAIWHAMAESQALVVILPEDISSTSLAFELGAAKAWNKPIYAVSAYSSHTNIPPALRGVTVLPVTRVAEIADSIASATDPLSQSEISLLGQSYTSARLPVDQLLLQPQKLADLVADFNKKSGRQLSGEQVMWHLLRLRKQSRLPALRKQALAKR